MPNVFYNIPTGTVIRVVVTFNRWFYPAVRTLDLLDTPAEQFWVNERHSSQVCYELSARLICPERNRLSKLRGYTGRSLHLNL